MSRPNKENLFTRKTIFTLAPAEANNAKVTAKRFNDAQRKHLEAAKNMAYDSSSDEELASDTWIDSVFKGYTGDKSDLYKTQHFLVSHLHFYRPGKGFCKSYLFVAFYFFKIYHNFFAYRYGHAIFVTISFIWPAFNVGQTIVQRKNDNSKTLRSAITLTMASMWRKSKKY